MNHKESLEIAKAIGDKIHSISLMTQWVQGGTSGKEACLLELRKSAGQMVSALVSSVSKAEVVTAFETLENNIRASIVIGLISHKVGEDYMDLMSKLGASIEEEK